MSIGVFRSTMARLSFLGKREMERAALAKRGAHRDLPAMALGDLLADREPDAGAGKLPFGMQLLEHHEDPLEVLRLDADAVVLDAELPFVPGFLHHDVDPGHRGRAE